MDLLSTYNHLVVNEREAPPTVVIHETVSGDRRLTVRFNTGSTDIVFSGAVDDMLRWLTVTVDSVHVAIRDDATRALADQRQPLEVVK